MGCDIHMIIQVRKGESWETVSGIPTYDDRNYAVFEALAGVRATLGLTPIAAQRGLPPGPLATIAGPDDDSWLGEHSFSWLTVAEILAYDWDQKVEDEGYVAAEEFLRWKQSGHPTPDRWCEQITGKDIRHLTNREALRRAENPHPWDSPQQNYTLAHWDVPLRRYARRFLAFVGSLSGLGEPQNVRIVFGFDS